MIIIFFGTFFATLIIKFLVDFIGYLEVHSPHIR